MPLYMYEAQDQYGNTASGVLDVANPADLRTRLSATGFKLTSVRSMPANTGQVSEESPTQVRSGGGTRQKTVQLNVTSPPPTAPGPAPSAAATAGATAAAPPARSSRQVASARVLSRRAHAMLFRELAAAFRSGMTAYQACDMIGGRFKTGPIARLLLHVKSQAQGGSGLADAIESSPVTLAAPNIGIIRAGEKGGFLPYVLDELGAGYERDQELHNRIAPPLLLYGGVGLPLMLLLWPASKIVEGAAALNSTDVSGSLSAGMHDYFQGVLTQSVPAALAILAVIILWRMAPSTGLGRRIADRLNLYIPMWGKIQRALSISRFLRLMGLLYKGGIPLREGWGLSAAAVPNTLISSRLAAQEAAIASGSPISSALRATGLFRTSEISMVATGEMAGEVDAMLFHLAQYEDESVARGMNTLPRTVGVLLLLGSAPLVILVFYHFFVHYMASILKWGDT